MDASLDHAVSAKWQLKLVNDPHTASVFIMDDCSKARTSVICRASLIGGVLLSTKAYASLGKSGVVMQHEAFLKPKKMWFLSQGFRDECPSLTATITNCFGCAGLKSVLADISKKDELILKSKRRSAAGYGTEFFFLISKAEKVEFNPMQMKNVVHVGKLLQTIRKIDDTASKLL